MDTEKIIDNFINLYEDLKPLAKNPDLSYVKKYLDQTKEDVQHLNETRINKNNFKIIKHIGKGGYGDVFLIKKGGTVEVGTTGSTSTSTSNYFALKTTKKEDISKENGTDGFMAERDILAQGGNISDYIIKLLYSFQDSKYLYYVMEFMQGGDLQNLIYKISDIIYDPDGAGSGLSALDRDNFEKDWKFYMAETINGINAIHQLGYIHRDLKPANILIDNTGHLKLGDFGTCLKMEKNKNQIKFKTGPCTLDQC